MADPNSPSQALVGAVLNGRWRLKKLLGEGGMGAVFEAESTRGEGTRAIKLLHAEFSKEEQILQRFFAEAQTSQQLQHPNIARTFESGRAEDGTPYLVMELLQGQPLANWIDAGQPIPPHQAAPIIVSVLQALHLAHQRRVVHRDLKPDNLFMTRDASGQYVVKVLDFGIAKVMDAAGGMGNKTRTGVLLGTPGYMSPEQIKNSKAVDARSDLWAVGIIFFEMLTCSLPYHAENEFARLTAVLTEDAKPIESVMPSLVAWSGFFRRALAREPTDRFQTAEEMANAINAVLRGSHPGAAPATAPAGGKGGATVAMAAYTEGNTPGPQTRPGTGTVPSTPGGPVTYQGAQAAAAPAQAPHLVLAPASMQAPATMGGAHAQHAPTPQPRQPSGTIQSAQQQAAFSPPLAPMAGDTSSARQNPTHVSAHAPPGVSIPSVPPPNIQVIDAPPLAKGVPVWIVGAVGAACLVVGFLIGFLVGR